MELNGECLQKILTGPQIIEMGVVNIKSIVEKAFTVLHSLFNLFPGSERFGNCDQREADGGESRAEPVVPEAADRASGQVRRVRHRVLLANPAEVQRLHQVHRELKIRVPVPGDRAGRAHPTRDPEAPF